MHTLRFFIGLDRASDAKNFSNAFISVGTLRKRKSDFKVDNWILDSQAFRTIEMHGGYPNPPEEYAAHINRWKNCGKLLAAVTQDYMCEPHMLKITGLDIATHQRLTIERYDALLRLVTDVYIMPVLQGYAPEDYVSHLRQYGDRLALGAWVGVGSVCKRNGNPRSVEDVLLAIKEERPDLRLHGFWSEIDSTEVWDCTFTSLFSRLDGMELYSPNRRTKSPRLARSRSVCEKS